MRNLTLIAIAFLSLLLQSALGALFTTSAWTPNLTLPLIIHLGVALDFPLVRGAAIAFAIGYLQDAFAGSPMGLQTFSAVAMLFVARGARLALFLRGISFRVMLTFLVAALSGTLVVALRAIFDRPAPFPSHDPLAVVTLVLLPALCTALVCPAVFWWILRADQWARGRHDATDVKAAHR